MEEPVMPVAPVRRAVDMVVLVGGGLGGWIGG